MSATPHTIERNSMNLQEAIESLDEGQDLDALTAAVLHTVTKGALYQPLRNYLSGVRRGQAHAQELAAFNEANDVPFSTLGDVAVSVPDADELSGFRYTTWDLLTIADHQSRIAYLERKRGGLLDTIRRHREAIAQCEAAGVDRLADLLVVAA